MHLREIQLENFKSFGHKLTIPFLEGFTAITGPNGSGKSNIADAIMFVLGPKSPKAIRAGKLTDLIFNGGKGGRPEKYCKVSLVFDNEDRLIPIDSNEVKLTRLVKISPSNKDASLSYFYVNGKPSSLGEFNDLLANAKISADGYNFVMQGDINAITRMSSLERRRILEDVAGITRFDRDIELSTRKRIDAEENLKMIELTLNEIRTEIKRLGRDREAALKYMEFKQRLEHAKALMAHKKRDMIEREIAAVREQISAYEQELEDARKRKAELGQTLEEVNADLEKVEEEIVEKGGDEARELKTRIDEARLEIARTKDVILSWKDRAREIKGARSEVANDLKAIRADLKAMEKEARTVRDDLDRESKALEAKKEEHDAFQKRLAESDSDIAKHQKHLIAINRKMEEARDAIKEATLEVERLSERRQMKLKALAEAEERMRVVDTTAKDAGWRLKELRESMGTTDRDVDDVRKRVYTLKKEETKLYEQVEKAQTTVRGLEREYTKVNTVKEYAQSKQTAVDALLQARDVGTLKGIHGSVSELAKVDEEYETALAIAAGSRMHAVIVDDDNSAAEGIAYLKKNKLGRVAFLPLNKMLPSKPQGQSLLAARDPGAVDLAINLVTFSDEYTQAFQWVFGSTVVVKDLKVARKLMGGVRLVTLEGELIEASGAMIGGTVKNTAKFGSTRAQEVDDVAERLRKESADLEALQGRLTVVRGELQTHERALRESAVNDEDLRLAKEPEIEVERAKTDAGRLSKEIASLQKEVAAAAAALGKGQVAVVRSQEVVAKLDAERKETHEALVSSTPDEVVASLRKLESEMNDLADACRELASREATVRTRMELVREREEELDGRLATMDREMEEGAAGAEKASERLAGLDSDLKVLLEVETNIAKEMKDLHGMRDRTYERKVGLEKEIDGLDGQLETRDDLLIGLRTNASSLSGQLEEATEEAKRYDIPLPETLPTLDELRKEIGECEARMRSLEPVNMRAVEDYEIYDARRREIEAEFERLQEQREHLIKVVEELIGKKKAGLLEVFEEVDRNFARIYKELSLGGEGCLELEDQKNPFEGGLAIVAKPPNKTIKKLVQLSGGEKSLTALALIFAIQEYDPSPFYLLDEVDMFLDAVNAERVAKRVAGNADRAQFIVITLRKVTLGHADHAYGVTMGECATSEVIGNVNVSQVGEKGEILTSQRASSASREETGGDAIA